MIPCCQSCRSSDGPLNCCCCCCSRCGDLFPSDRRAQKCNSSIERGVVRWHQSGVENDWWQSAVITRQVNTNADVAHGGRGTVQGFAPSGYSRRQLTSLTKRYSVKKATNLQFCKKKKKKYQPWPNNPIFIVHSRQPIAHLHQLSDSLAQFRNKIEVKLESGKIKTEKNNA